MAYSQGRPIYGATRVRQARMGRSVFWVLVFAIALTVLGFAATWAWKAGDLAPAGAGDAASGLSGKTPSPPEPPTR